MKKISSILAAILLCNICSTQIIDNKLNIVISPGTGRYTGTEIFNEDGYIYPALFKNYRSTISLSATAVYEITGYLSAGINIQASHSSDWKIEGFHDYSNSKLKQYFFCPVIQVHNKFKETGVFNRISVFLEVYPVTGKTDLSLAEKTFEVIIDGKTSSFSGHTSFNHYGLGAGTGIYYYVSQNTGISAGFSMKRCKVTSVFFNEKEFTSWSISTGFIIRLLKNKNYYY